MTAIPEILRHSCANSAWNYTEGGPSSAEPAAWASLALACEGELSSAVLPARWLQDIQASDGSVGVTASQQRPAWPTSLAVIAWTYLDSLGQAVRFQHSTERAIQWCLSTQGKTAERQSEIGHDPSLRGWAWADGTHSWLEPTAMFVMALKAAGYHDHPRTREAVRLLVDRMLPEGGCNYGNTMVLGQTLLPHVQPTGLVLMALAGEDINDQRVNKSIELLERSIDAEASVASLCYAVIGLRAHFRHVPHAERTLELAARRTTNCYHAALVSLANSKELGWLLPVASVGEVAAS